MWGWFPIYDTMHGIRGEVHCAVKVDLFSDSNRFRQSSCGVRFFYSPGIPYGYACQAILGFVEELVVNDDPEYQWIDKIRTPRASNEARQTLFSKLSGEVKRKIGLKALELGGNSVVGYQQYFDLEGESGIVVRGIGTAVVLTRLENPSRQHSRSYTQKTSQVTYCTPLQTSKHPGTSEETNHPLGEENAKLKQSFSVDKSPNETFEINLSQVRLACDSMIYDCNELKSCPCSSEPSADCIIPVAFLSNIEMPLPYPYSYSIASSPSPPIPERSSSPVFNFNAPPKIYNWFSRITRTSSKRGNLAQTQNKIEKSSTTSEFSQNTPKTQSLRNSNSKHALKRVSSQPVTKSSSSSLITIVPPKIVCPPSPLFTQTLRTFSSTRNVNQQFDEDILDYKKSRSSEKSNLLGLNLSPPLLTSSPSDSNISLLMMSKRLNKFVDDSDDENEEDEDVDFVTDLETFDSVDKPLSKHVPFPIASTLQFKPKPMKNISTHSGDAEFPKNIPCETKESKNIPISSFPSSSYDACINQRQLSSSATSTTSTAMGSASNIQRQTNGQSVSPRVNTVLGTSPGVMANIGSSRHGSSDPDLRGISNQKANSNHSSLCGSVGKSFYKFMISPESFHLLEYPFITMKQFAPGFVAHIGGTVSSRSVKLLDHINCPDDPESRDTWWMELRKEIRCHCRSLACNAVLGYSEATYICDNVVILSASGTAVVVATGSNSNATHSTGSKGGGDTIESGKAQSRTDVPTKTSQQTTANSSPIDQQTSSSSTYLPPSCAICHIPYPESSVPFHSSLLNCNLCKKAKVLDVIFMTIEPPPNIPIVGKGCLIQARVCRNKRDSKGEQCAKEISDSLPFLEHELHRQLLSKVKVKGMNAIFGLTVQISFGENMLIALATGTAAYVAALPPPKPPRVSSGKGVNTTDLNAIQKLILESISRYREHYGLSHIPLQPENDANESERNNASKTVIDNSQEYSDNGAKNGDDGSSDILSSKDGCVILEVDDTEDADIISLMIDSDVPKGYEICNTETMPGLVNQFTGVLQTFAHVHRVKLMAVKQFGQQFDWIIQELFVKLRRLIPCCLADLKFRVDLPEQDLVQVTVLGTAVGLSGICYPIPPGSSDVRSNRLLPVAVRRRRALSANDSCDDLLFNMDDENSFNDECDTTLRRSGGSGSGNELANQSNFIELTPLSYIPGAHIQKYLGNLDFFFIRETTSVRENGGLNGFILSFLSEVYAIVRAHVASLSGNAMVSLHLNQCVLMNNPHKNQAQCLINVAGDVVCIQSCSQKFVN
ncbi:C2 domain-containing protein 5 isoform X2 [Brevipalpus obovatus]